MFKITIPIMMIFCIVLVWACSGPVFHYSEMWQLVINTGTTIITFLMVFLIQKAQNKDSLAIHLKLNELIKSHKESSNRLIDVENLSESQMLSIQKRYENLNAMNQKVLKEIKEDTEDLKESANQNTKG